MTAALLKPRMDREIDDLDSYEEDHWGDPAPAPTRRSQPAVSRVQRTAAARSQSRGHRFSRRNGVARRRNHRF